MSGLLPVLITVLQRTLSSSRSLSEIVSWADVAKLYKTNTASKKLIQTLNFTLCSLPEVPRMEQAEVRELLESLQVKDNKIEDELQTFLCFCTLVLLALCFDSESQYLAHVLMTN